MTSIELAKRQEKSVPLEVFQVTEDQFYVENSKGKICYKVNLNGNGRSCTCADFTTNGKKDTDFMCKHLFAVINSNGNHQRIGPIVDTEERYPEPKDNLGVYQAISAVQMSLTKGGIKKTQENKYDKYKFRGIDDVYNTLAPMLAEHGLCILPKIISRTCEERISRKGDPLFYVTVNAEFDFVAVSDGSKHTIKMFGEAMDRSDKATNKAMSAAYKYACFQTFCIPTEGDNDADLTSHEVEQKSKATVTKKSKPKAEPKPKARKEKESKDESKPPKEQKAKKETKAKEPVKNELPKDDSTMSTAQQKAIQNLAKRRGISDEGLEEMCRNQYSVSLKDLPSKDASVFIRNLQQAA